MCSVRSSARLNGTTNDSNFKTHLIAMEIHVSVGSSSAMNLTATSEKLKIQQELRHVASCQTM